MSTRITKYFVNSDPISVIITRPQRETTVSGGVVDYRPEPLESQIIRLTHSRRSQGREGDGDNTTTIKYQLVAPLDTDIKMGDEFIFHEENYFVEYINPLKDYEITGVVTLRRTDGAAS
jgi:hypothetical protein